MAEVVNGDIIRHKSANVGKRKQLIKGDGGIDVPGEFNKQLYKFLRNKRHRETYLLALLSKYSKAPCESSTGQPSTKRAEGQYSALMSIFTGTMVKVSLK